MRTFLDDHFLLYNDTAVDIFKHIRDLPIVDYHCHLSPREIAENKRFNNITELWLGGDHYKWRLMRAYGVDESLITGHAPDFEKFKAWCYTLEDCIGSPLYHWAHMELQRYFDYDGIVRGTAAADIYAHCNAVINREDFNVATILRHFNVQMLATTDDPADSLEYHRQIKENNNAGLPLVLPAFRPSKALDIESFGFSNYINELGAAAGMVISDWDDFLCALTQRIDFFDSMGCRASDHALDPPVFSVEAAMESDESNTRAAQIFKHALKGETVSPEDVIFYKTRLLLWLGASYAGKGWVMQLHMGAQRNNNTRMLRITGQDTGFDSISDAPFSWALSRLLDTLEVRDVLPRTILYATNPAADDMLSVMIGNFQGRGIRGRIQWGCPWWFNDNRHGIKKHLTTLANNGMLSLFVGMLTDSRSFMSYPRHEYFRRVLAQTLGQWTEDGEFPHDMERLYKIAGDIAFNNAKAYFKINEQI